MHKQGVGMEKGTRVGQRNAQNMILKDGTDITSHHIMYREKFQT